MAKDEWRRTPIVVAVIRMQIRTAYPDPLDPDKRFARPRPGFFEITKSQLLRSLIDKRLHGHPYLAVNPPSTNNVCPVM